MIKKHDLQFMIITGGTTPRAEHMPANPAIMRARDFMLMFDFMCRNV